MKYRKSNRAKRVSHSCRNNGSCAVCYRDRQAANVRALPADEEEQRRVAGAIFVDDEESRTCCICRDTAEWKYPGREGGAYCDLCVPRGGCSCYEDEDGTEMLQDDGRPYPCVDYMWLGDWE